MEKHWTHSQLLHSELFASNTIKAEMLLVLLYITANGNNVESLQSFKKERTQSERNKYAVRVQLCLVGS